MSKRRMWLRSVLAVGLAVLAVHQIWRHGSDYVFAQQFAEVVPGKVYRGAWQKEWPMRRIARDRGIKTILALAHPHDSAIAVKERTLAEELGIKWVHVPIVDQRGMENPKTVFQLLDEAAAVVNDSKNHPIYFHCHHGLNRVSMVQIAYRTKYCGWTLEQATEEVAAGFGLVEANHGPDYRTMVKYYAENVLPFREEQKALAARADAPTAAETPSAEAAPAVRR
ncbi:fused DSP-PTPase phosphatase/NAD kinase-like protein [Planctomyces sp. SH-PL62]|uniref:fused DSP-PTPase phosphatase/NAD kinase-like protein n=1 Tax=Planctomyces sp. SH-PL62 TaxID=1636152 RepID=UPI00078B2563|nr:dual specificity protein phosphatase family protein [Planctomyces sp. SH-PL62]AMV40004.1 Tyrosine phosphatase family protein [Planctomyces sp. SH-PL62]